MGISPTGKFFFPVGEKKGAGERTKLANLQTCGPSHTHARMCARARILGYTEMHVNNRKIGRYNQIK